MWCDCSFAVESPSPFQLSLAGPEKPVLPGARPLFQATVKNGGKTPVTFVMPQDGSDSGRFPIMKLSITDSAGKDHPIKLAGRCGLFAPMSAVSIKTIPPGGTVNFTVSTLECAVWQIYSPFDQPGRYQVSLSYDMRADKSGGWSLDYPSHNAQQKSVLEKLLRTVPSVELTSAPVEVNVQNATADLVKDSLLAYYCNQSDAIHVNADYRARKWSVDDVRYGAGHISAMVRFSFGYAPREAPLNGSTRTGPGRECFSAGRYVFAVKVGKIPDPSQSNLLKVVGRADESGVAGTFSDVAAREKSKLGI